MRLAMLVGLVGLAACGPSAGGVPSAAPAPPDASPLHVDGDPNGLWWDAASDTLLLADDDGDRILAWSDASGFSVLHELPASEGGAGLGQLVRTGDGSIVVTRFGHGKRGDVLVVPAAGAPHAVGGLTKPVGVLGQGDRLCVSDRDAGQILVAPTADPAARTELAAVPRPDLLAAGPEGSLFAGSAGGSVYRIGSDGAVSLVHAGFREVRGVAYDPERRRLFVADHDPDEKDGTSHLLHRLPVD